MRMIMVGVACIFIWCVSQLFAQKQERRLPHDTCSQCSVVEQALVARSKLKNGVTRAEVERDFVMDGGLIFRTSTSYVFSKCQFIKVKIEFEVDSKTPGVEPSAHDRVKDISALSVEYPMKD
jgi:hypothetical protein